MADMTAHIISLEADLAAARAEIERLTKERDAQYDENVHRIAMQAKAEAERDAARFMLADAERDMRQRAADLCDCACMDGIGDEIRAIGDAILALPLKHADREDSGALAQGQKEGAER